tara:strand:+ start:422 stop:910 length:489 start_codon:yes stop_codon:yes gene_type:complete
VVAQHGENAVARRDGGDQFLDSRLDGPYRSFGITLEVACKNAKIGLDAGDHGSGYGCRFGQIVNVKIAEMKDPETFEIGGQIGNFQGHPRQFEIKRIAPAPAVEPQQAERQRRRRQQSMEKAVKARRPCRAGAGIPGTGFHGATVGPPACTLIEDVQVELGD